MPSVEFSGITYYPDILCTPGEHMGYRQLSDQDKNALVPIFGLSRRSGAPDLVESIRMINESVGNRPFLLDLDPRPAPPPYVARDPIDPEADRRRVAAETQAQESYNRELRRLLSAQDGFSAWREFCDAFPEAVPFLQFEDPVADRLDLLRQAAMFARGGNSIAIKIRQDSDPAIIGLVAQVIAILDRPGQLLIVIDCGQGRVRVSERAEFAKSTIQAILSELSVTQRSEVRAVCMSNSFNAPNHSGLRDRPMPNLDWRLWREASEVYPFAFGDYVATHRSGAHSSFQPRDWRAAVVYPLDEAWLAYRAPNANDEQGWIDGSAAIRNRPEYRPTPEVWGVNMIEQAANGNLEGLNSARFWYATKVNIHIHRQIAYSAEQLEAGASDDEDGDI